MDICKDCGWPLHDDGCSACRVRKQNKLQCCKHRTLEEHFEHLGWCWGLVEQVKGGETVTCGGCPERKEEGNG